MVSSIFTKNIFWSASPAKKTGFRETELEKFIPMLYETSGGGKEREIIRSGRMVMDASQVHMWREPEISVHMALTITVHCAF